MEKEHRAAERRQISNCTIPSFLFPIADRRGLDVRIAVETAVGDCLREVNRRDVIVVCHGTVISLFVAEQESTDPLLLWAKLGLPSFVVLSRPDLRLLERQPEYPDL